MNNIRRSSRTGRSRNNFRNNGRRNSNSNSNGINLGNAKAAHEKYLEKAKEAISSGDRVSAENFLQYADHYKRIIVELEEKREAAEEENHDNNDNNDNGDILDSEESINDETMVEPTEVTENKTGSARSTEKTRNIPKELAL